VAALLADLGRSLLGALVAGVLPGHYWARFVRRSDGLAEHLAYSAALSVALVPVAAVALARLLGSGVSLVVAVAAIMIVAASGWLACRGRGPGSGPPGPALPPPRPIRDVRVLALLAVALGVTLAASIGRPAPGWVLIVIMAALVLAGLLSQRAPAAETRKAPADQTPARAAAADQIPALAAPSLRNAGRDPGLRWRGPVLAAVLALTAALSYTGVVWHDWPYLRGEDQFSHAVMTQQMLAHGSYSSYLIYPPGFSTMSAVICRLTGLAPLQLFPVLAPALLLLTTLSAYALATRLWGWRYGLAAAALGGLVLVGPYQSFAGGLYPDLLSAFFLMVMTVTALIGLYQAPSLRSGLLFCAVGGAVIWFHSVNSLYLVLLVGTVVLVCLPYLLLRGRAGRALAKALALSLAGLAVVSLAYAAYIYDLGTFFGGDSTARATVDLDVNTQSVLKASDLLVWVGSPVVWLGVFGFAALAMMTRRLKEPAQVLAALTVLLWCVVMYLGSRTAIDGFPQRFERDVGAPLNVLAALGTGIIVQSLAGLRARWPGRLPARLVPSGLVAAALAVVAAAAVVIQVGGNAVADSAPSREVLTPAEAAAGRWLAQHNTGGTIISTPDLRRGVTNRAVLAMGGYVGLQSYELPKLAHPRSLPGTGIQQVLDSRTVLSDPASCAAAAVIGRDDVRYIFVYWPGTQANLAAFEHDPAMYRQVFRNSEIVIYAPDLTGPQGSMTYGVGCRPSLSVNPYSRARSPTARVWPDLRDTAGSQASAATARPT
jgi:hypothetical protein